MRTFQLAAIACVLLVTLVIGQNFSLSKYKPELELKIPIRPTETDRAPGSVDASGKEVIGGAERWLSGETRDQKLKYKILNREGKAQVEASDLKCTYSTNDGTVGVQWGSVQLEQGSSASKVNMSVSW